MTPEEEIKNLLEKHRDEIIEILSAPISPDVIEETERIKRLHQIEWARIKDIPFTI